LTLIKSKPRSTSLSYMSTTVVFWGRWRITALMDFCDLVYWFWSGLSLIDSPPCP
jgi:hypothetical protein